MSEVYCPFDSRGACPGGCPTNHARACVNGEPVGTVTELLHSFNQETGICRCGAGPLTTPEWVAHYKAQDEPVRATPTHPVTEYGTTRCPIERVAAEIDAENGTCSACGEVVTPPVGACGICGGPLNATGTSRCYEAHHG